MGKAKTVQLPDTYFQWILLILIIAGFLLLSPGITPSFSSDDYTHLVRNISFQSVKDVLSVFTEFDGREYRPIVRLSLWFNYQHSHTAEFFHVTNIFLHLLNILLVYGISRKLGFNSANSLLVAVVFALLPVHSSSIHFIMGRTDLLCALFYLLAVLNFLVYCQNHKIIYFIFTVLFYIFSLMSKEMAVSLPLVLTVLILTQSEEFSHKLVFQSFKKLWIIWAIMIIYLFIRLFVWVGQTGSIAVYTNYSPFHLLKNFATWFFGMVYPFDLYSARALMEENFMMFSFLVLTCLFLIIAGMITLFKKDVLKFFKHKLFIAGMAWFLITLTPIMGGLPQRWYLYLPSVSLGFMLAAGTSILSGIRLKIYLAGILVYLLLSANEIYNQSITWEKQSEISESFFNQIEIHDLHNKDGYVFANMPFGYKSTFLFTFESLEDALQIRYGRRPDIKILSFLNCTDKPNLETNRNGSELEFKLIDDPFSFFVFPYTYRRFVSTQQFFTQDSFQAQIMDLNAAGEVLQYKIVNLAGEERELYFFDSEKIRKMSF